MHFEFPWAFLLLVILPPLLWVMRRGWNRTREVAATYHSRPPQKSYFIARMVFASVFIVSLITIGARPYINLEKTGDFLFLIDVSRSMQARQSCGEPTFLERSRRVMRDIVTGIPEGRFGIVAFDRFAFPITQMTRDHDYIREVIEHGVHIGLTFQATDTELANALSVVARKKQKLPGSYGGVRHVILLSDGYVEGDFRRRMQGPVQELKDAGIKVVAVGIGNPGETPIMEIEDGKCLNQHIEIEGQTIMIPLRDDILKFIASQSKGQYFAEGDTDKLVQLLRSGMVEALPADTGIEGGVHRDVSWIFLVMATLALAGLVVMDVNIRFK